jgi:hypothetical protein
MFRHSDCLQSGVQSPRSPHDDPGRLLNFSDGLGAHVPLGDLAAPAQALRLLAIRHSRIAEAASGADAPAVVYAESGGYDSGLRHYRAGCEVN